MAGWTGSKGKRQPSGETKRALMDKALVELEKTGLRASLDHVNLEALIREVGSPRSTVFRIWPTKEDFLAELLVELINPRGEGKAAYNANALQSAREVFRAHRESGSARDVTDTVREAVRIGVVANFEAICKSREWQSYMVASLSYHSFPEPQKSTILEALRSAQQNFIDVMVEFYDSLLEISGLKLKHGLTTEQLAVAGSAVLEGLAQRRSISNIVVDTPLIVVGEGGHEEQWHLAAYAFLGIIMQFLDA